MLLRWKTAAEMRIYIVHWQVFDLNKLHSQYATYKILEEWQDCVRHDLHVCSQQTIDRRLYRTRSTRPKSVGTEAWRVMVVFHKLFSSKHEVLDAMYVRSRAATLSCKDSQGTWMRAGLLQCRVTP